MYISLIRTVILYAAIILAVRIMGKRQISQLQTSELVVTMLISDLAVIPMQDNGQPLFSGLLPIFVLIVLEVFLSLLMLKNGRIRHLICGNPIIVIRQGKILQNNLRILRMSIDDLFEQMRQKDVFAIKDVAYAIVETNGALSIIKYAEADYLRPADVGIKPPDPGLETVAISDGKISPNALEISGKNQAWLKKILKQEKTPLEEVFILTVNTVGDYTLIRKENARK